MCLSIGTNIGDLEWRNGHYFHFITLKASDFKPNCIKLVEARPVLSATKM